MATQSVWVSISVNVNQDKQTAISEQSFYEKNLISYNLAQMNIKDVKKGLNESGYLSLQRV